MKEILVLYYSHRGSVRAIAEQIALGIDSTGIVAARLRTVPRVSSNIETPEAAIPENGPPYAEHSDLEDCIGLALGSPTRFGNMAAPMKYFLDGTSAQWLSGALAGKPACVFTSTGTLHGGQETTLLSMMLPLLHHGALVLGLPYTEGDLHSTQSGGSPYGASHVSGPQGDARLSDAERRLAFAQGRRLADVAARLAGVAR
ncbi:NAD(P)H:quinone oxidoreductase [Niveibacterium microcysteis]|uniref:Flavoprotein WrbA n=1 Tax=Niveibacterium microcysteis TaxID=2811415 RepID=A0ABX7MCA6_9RHOO|nr:NAD(P)H:quinone oxidoreductase [Niveibacterium microcysteis]QSI78343.1 NAD(P)H:quinone oxidoreductase [Niveibacterium microcysteis]